MNNEKKIILFTFMSHFLFHFYEIAFPALAIPLVLSLKMDLKEVLSLGFPMYLMFGVCALPWGLFADRFSNRIALIICFFGGAAGCLMTAFSTTPSSIMISLMVIGVFACICHPAGMGLISHSAGNVGTGLGIFSVAGSVGLVVGPFLAGMLNWIAGWRIAYLIIGIFSIVWGIVMVLTKIDETPVEREASGNEPEENSSGHPLKRLILFFSIVTLGGFAYRINIIALPAYLEFKAGFLLQFFHNLNIPDIAATKTMAAAVLTSAIYIVGIAGQLYGGRIADRYELRGIYFIYNAVSLPFVILMAVFTQQWLVFASAAYVFFALGIQPIENSLIAKFTPRKWRSTGYGLAAILIFGVGALAVFLIGWVSQRWSLGTVYLFSGAIVFIIVIGIIILIMDTRGIVFRNVSKRSVIKLPDH